MRISVTLVAAAVIASSGWVYAWKATTAPKPNFVQSLERVGSRALWFGNNTITGQFHISHGSPMWKEAYEGQLDTIPDGSRVRFGKDFWTTFETTIPVSIGGTRLEPDYYYLAIARNGDGLDLVAYQAARLREQRIGSFQPPQEGGAVIEMALEKGERVEDDLACDFVVDNTTGDVVLEITWGPYTLSAPVVAELTTD